MSVATSPPAGGERTAAAAPQRDRAAGEACPLCGAPLHPEQEWCLRCGAAARTRLAASPRWKGLIATLAVVVALSLGVLAAALVKLAGGSGSTARDDEDRHHRSGCAAPHGARSATDLAGSRRGERNARGTTPRRSARPTTTTTARERTEHDDARPRPAQRADASGSAKPGSTGSQARSSAGRHGSR